MGGGVEVIWISEPKGNVKKIRTQINGRCNDIRSADDK
jgi:hypothetical protein